MSWSEFKDGLTSAYGTDENGEFQYREYVNETGKLAGTYLIDYKPVAGLDNHFIVVPNEDQVVISVPSWDGYMNNPSFELQASTTNRNLAVFAQTTDGGVQPLSMIITSQDSVGNTTKVESGLIHGSDYSSGYIYGKAGYTYFFRFVWPPSITVQEPPRW